MNFCSSLCRDINFEPSFVQPCCDVYGIEIPRFPFSGGKLDIPAYVAHIENVFKHLQTDGDTLCCGCPELQEVSDDMQANLRVLFQTVSINMHRHLCNCKCVYCDLWRGKGEGYPILPVLQSLQEQRILAPDCYFSWGGGEPSILRDFEDTSIWIREHGWLQYIHTNCLRFSPAIVSLLQDGRGGINISLDSGSAAIYQKVKGIDGFNKVCENLERYAAATTSIKNIHLKYIIFEMNNSAAEIKNFFSICTQLGIINVQYSLNFKEMNKSSPSPKTLLAAAFFHAMAEQLGLNCIPSFIPLKWQATIDDLRRKHFQA